MRRLHLGFTALSSLGLMMAAPAAMAGNCASGGGQNCHPGVVYNAAGAPTLDPLLINVRQPLEDLRSVHIRTAPAVSITRLYGQQPLAGLQDAPSGFQGGCHPTTTQYCRQNIAAPASFARPVPAPAPVVSPVITPRVQYGGGYNPQAFQPRQYGENIFTPGIAHIPTSYVDRSPHTANRLLASGLTQSYQAVSHHNASPFTGGQVQLSQPANVSSTHSQTSNAVSPVASDGTYWEQVSGPTLFGDTLATQVVCKRQAPVRQVQTVQVQRQVVRPIIPVPVAVPVHCENTVVNSRYGLNGASQPVQNFGGPIIQAPLQRAPQLRPFAGQVQLPPQAQGWGVQPQGRWTY